MAAARIQPGDVLGGKYKVERVLGAGGMGVVVAAQHVDLGQRVALKFMLQEAMRDPSLAERFFREAKAAVQLKSMHTARVLDVGRLENDEPFMVMEYLEGRDLDSELLARGRLPPHVAVDYVLQASEAIAEAHALGMVHRDLKPKNLFLTTSVDGRPLVKVLDFGLAKTHDGDVSLTTASSIFGSPQYMSPEQMRSAKSVDARSDIWSIGICLYELLTGRVPFEAQGFAEICAMVLKDPVPPPSRFIHDLPRDLERVVLRCLEKDANLRYQSVAELAFALERYAPDASSARRILLVMQTAQRADATPLIAPSDGPPCDGRTLDTWDAELSPPRSPARLRRPELIWASIGIVLIGFVGAAGVTMSMKNDEGNVVPASEGRSAESTPQPIPRPELRRPPNVVEAEPEGLAAALTSATPEGSPTEETLAVQATTALVASASATSTRIDARSDFVPPGAAPVDGKASAKTRKTKAATSKTRAPKSDVHVKPKNSPGSGAEYL